MVHVALEHVPLEVFRFYPVSIISQLIYLYSQARNPGSSSTQTSHPNLTINITVCTILECCVMTQTLKYVPSLRLRFVKHEWFMLNFRNKQYLIMNSRLPNAQSPSLCYVPYLLPTTAYLQLSSQSSPLQTRPYERHAVLVTAKQPNSVDWNVVQRSQGLLE
jgi:hypothetical protein